MEASLNGHRGLAVLLVVAKESKTAQERAQAQNQSIMAQTA